MWKKVEGYKNVEVTQDGAVKTWHAGWGRYVIKNQRDDKDGYKRVNVQRHDGVRTTARVHRLVAIAYIPNPDNKPQVNHINGIKYDNRVDNLEWATVAENTQHGYDKLGVMSAQSVPYLLKIDGHDFSTYQSLTYLSKEIGINRNFRNDKSIISINDLTEGYFSIEEISDAVKYSEEHNIPFNKKVWNAPSYILNTLGRFYKCGDRYFDRMKDLSDHVGLERSSIYRIINSGVPSRKGILVEDISCKEYLVNCKYRNW